MITAHCDCLLNGTLETLLLTFLLQQVKDWMDDQSTRHIS